MTDRSTDTIMPGPDGLDGNGKNEEFAVGTTVTTPYGVGEVVEYRPHEKQVVITLANNGGKAYLQETIVKRKKKLFEMDDADKLKQSRFHREEGNVFFKMEDYSVASHKYELARVYLRQMTEQNKEEHLSLLNNLVLTNIKLGNYADAVLTCDESVSTHFTNTGDNLNAAEVKCLYLRAMANRKRGDLEAALKDLLTAVKASPKNKSVRDEYEAVVKEMKAARDKEAAIFKKAFKAESSTVTPPGEKGVELLPKASLSNSSAENNSGNGGQEGFFTKYGTTLMAGAAAMGLALIILGRRT